MWLELQFCGLSLRCSISLLLAAMTQKLEIPGCTISMNGLKSTNGNVTGSLCFFFACMKTQ